MVAGVMACSQELHKGDLVAVSIAMEAAGSEGYITRGSCVGSDPPAIPSLYVGMTPVHTHPVQQRKAKDSQYLLICWHRQSSSNIEYRTYLLPLPNSILCHIPQ